MASGRPGCFLPIFVLSGHHLESDWQWLVDPLLQRPRPMTPQLLWLPVLSRACFALAVGKFFFLLLFPQPKLYYTTHLQAPESLLLDISSHKQILYSTTQQTPTTT